MKKIFLYCILISALAFQLWGCGKPDAEASGDGGTAGAEDSGNSLESEPSGAEDSETSLESKPSGGESSDPKGEDLFLSLEDIPWRDNSMDAYSAVINVPLRHTEPEGAMVGGAGAYILGSNGVSVFKKHLFEQVDDCWDEVKAVSDQGGETSFRLDFWEGKINQAEAVGGIAGSDRYMMMTVEADADDDQKNLYRFFETDEEMRILNSFYVDCLDEAALEIPTQLQVDAGGNIHMIAYNFSDSTEHYYIVASDGTLLAEVSPKEGYAAEQTPELCLLYDGRVGVRFEEQLKCVDVETGKTEVLADIKSDYRCCTLWDEKTLLYADGKGLYRSGLSGENPELLYTWSNHGIAVSGVADMQVAENQGIGLVYVDSKGANYLKLKPTTEEVEIQEITFAVPINSGEKYRSAVVAFNKKYPSFRIQMKTYSMNDTSLLTELIAGKGPVLVDTALAGFENNAEYWEPLDEVFRQMKLDEELLPQVMDTGKINGTLYGVVTDFSLNSVVTLAEEPEEWDYDTFLSCFDEEDPSIKSVVNGLNGSDGYSFISTFFLHGLKENYLYDAEEGTTRFDSEEFRKILKLAAIFIEKEHLGSIEDLQQGTSLCAVACIKRPEDLACIRIWGGGKLRYIGYPSGEGSAHYIECGSPLTVRANATAEEKRLAHNFIRFLLSYEAQMETVSDPSNTNFDMSARKDVLEEQINRMNENTYPFTIGFPQIHLEDQVDIEQDRATLYDLLERAEPKQYMPRELTAIFVEELSSYLDGSITEDMLIDHLENRVGLYLSEQ